MDQLLRGKQRALDAAGGVVKLARLLGISHQTVYNWPRIPAHQVIPIEKLTGVPREQLRPDLHPPRASTTN